MKAVIISVILLLVCTASVVAAEEAKLLDENSPEVKQFVLARLREPTAEEVEKIKTLIKSIASVDPEESD